MLPALKIHGYDGGSGGYCTTKTNAIGQKGENKNNAAATSLLLLESSDEKLGSAFNKNNIECFSLPQP